ncbi:RagB/SusD family nutrient uptake outer membrane protein [Butyricimonas hominis]|uniref:RagB/SusD family nutrient uptake outer membrane protein n=1 Tax=Butyricimonas hominis TaxID=2763032 RepID=A0ABR7D158_9BACT|nr:RagB/SusD family nutrient uptake outer membrane protein [Butyricimonas hominis]MBC5621681.1 RagB/SusD family nutrient uptake outer membrane protein [Butyricimonas hominis]
MKKIICGIIITLTVWITGCTGMIDMTPESDVTFNSFFNSVKDAEALLTSLEVALRDAATGDNVNQLYIGWIADTVSNSYAPYREFSPSTIEMSWAASFTAINSADVIIENAHRFPADVDVTPYVLQAYFAKGLLYFNLARRWGEAPIRKDYNDYSKLGKSSVHEVLEVATVCALKALDLPVFDELKDGNGNARTTKQYASKGAAAALLAHIYAWRAEIESVPEYWAEAEKYCSMIIEGKAGNYTLASDPEALCQNEMLRNGNETIWEIYRGPQEYYGKYNAYCAEEYTGFPVRTESRYAPTPTFGNYLVEIYRERVNKMFHPEDRRRDAYFYGLDADSLFVVYNKGTKKQFALAVEYRPEGNVYTKYDNSKKCTVVRDLFLEEGDSIVTGGRFGNTKRAYVIKHRNPYYVEYDYSMEPIFKCYDENKVVWRLADIILLRAECRARQDARSGGAISDLNRVRERAYGNTTFNYPCADDVVKGLDSDLRLAIFREREKELMFEDHRYYDVVRNGWGRDGGRDYVRTELTPAASRLTDQDILDGALYMSVASSAFKNNDLMRQNVYWNRKKQ